MTTTISMSEDTKERFDSERPDEVDSADEFVNLLLDVYDGEFEYEQEALFERLSALEDIAGSNNIQREEFREQLDRIEEELTGHQPVTLEATEYRKIAEEVEGRLR